MASTSNISLDVPELLVQIPPDYKPIGRDRWVKLEKAKLTYGGKASKPARRCWLLRNLTNTVKCSSMPAHEFEHGVVEKTESKEKLERPPLYKVLLHNDDFTTMEFVVFILQTVFNHRDSDAVRIMLNVHRQGMGLAGVYTYEVAQMKVDKATSIAQANEFPLLCTMEEDDHQGT